MAKISKVVGIDLGTTNSVIAMMGPDNKTIICSEDSQKRRTFPSVIVWDKKTEKIQSGQTPFNKRGTTPEPITSIKRHMGDITYRSQVGPLELSPIEVSAEILKGMKIQMEEYLSKTPGCEDYVIDRAIITIPAHFKSEAAEATSKAGELAGFEVVKTLQEPSSSCAYYCWKNGITDGIYMVYDLGGGTFDVSIVRYAGNRADVAGISGNNYLGGDTFDELLAKKLLEELQSEYVLDLDMSDEKDRQRFTRLKLSAEVIKKNLSMQDEYYFTYDGRFEDQAGAMVNIATTVTRRDFEDLIAPALQGTLAKCKIALEDAEKKGVELDDIDGVLLVGGSTHIPFVQEFVRKNFCDESLPHHTKSPVPLIYEPDMAVGFGAAVTAASAYGDIIRSETPVPAMQSENQSGPPSAFGATLTVEVEINPAVSVMGKSTVSGKIKAVAGKLPANMTAIVTRADMSESYEFEVPETGSFMFKGLKAPTKDEPHTCVIMAGGEQITSFTFNAARAVEGVPSPTTLSHALYIEVTDTQTGKIYMQPLMEKGTNLPSSGEYNFITISEYSALIRIFEERTHLCDIRLEFKEPVPKGSPVVIRLEINDKSTKHIYATAAGVSQNAIIEPPPLHIITEADVREQLARYESIVAVLPMNKKIEAIAKKNGEIDPCVEEIRQAIAEKDNVHANESFNELVKIIDDIVPPELIPPKKEFMDLADDCIDLIHEHHNSNPEYIKKTDNYKTLGGECYERHSQEELTQHFTDLQGWHKVLDKEKPKPPPPPTWMIVQMMCRQILEDMDTAESNDALQAETGLRIKSEEEHDNDYPTVIEIENKTNLFTIR